MSRKIDLESVPNIAGSTYPSPYDEPCRTRSRQRLADAGGLTQFGVNLCHLSPGSWTSQRHWHTHEDEFVYVLEGEVTLVSDDGEETLHAGDCVAFRANDPDGHCIQNRSGKEAKILEIGSRRMEEDVAFYSDLDMKVGAGLDGFVHRDGTPYPKEPRKT